MRNEEATAHMSVIFGLRNLGQKCYLNAVVQVWTQSFARLSMHVLAPPCHNEPLQTFTNVP
jgi:ubiquitin C-terminal hydrolase